ncbi:GNAT family N-acetyltransferase [Bradyrhizobium sp. JYMT SZCCT0428]|uniref:GNAT family N-acetyltransferase n=1 Tax=Bradyrhizobium sp. JYMT SZCCT0428 TaxID=2807673 RepID=UPI001BA806B2|nr:GNAT family protein [Bradyrhizobium sp. JYMT SZCCT0428]MBR1154329.1 GNAT family N-acetyltransferase [Bradyrhizobium sp. JYMT SZCCT0428]
MTAAPSAPPPPWPFPERIRFEGRSVSLEPLAARHADELWRAAQGADASFAYLRYGPFAQQCDLLALVTEFAGRADQPFWVVRPNSSGVAEGWLSLCDIYPAEGAIEIGAIWFSPRLQRTRAATEAIFLLMQYAMEELQYQRLVWRCNAANQASLNAAARYGFTPEGTWRGSALSKGRRCDVAWHSIIAAEWPSRRAAIAAWLADENFDEHGRARTRLVHP